MKEVHQALDAYLQSEKAGEKVVGDMLNYPSVKALVSHANELMPKVRAGMQEIQVLLNSDRGG